jgi:hypothetical protein
MNNVKLTQIDRLTTDDIIRSLQPGRRDCLKTRPDGTILDGHHRIFILRGRGVDVDTMAREIIEAER